MGETIKYYGETVIVYNNTIDKRESVFGLLKLAALPIGYYIDPFMCRSNKSSRAYFYCHKEGLIIGSTFNRIIISTKGIKELKKLQIQFESNTLIRFNEREIKKNNRSFFEN